MAAVDLVIGQGLTVPTYTDTILDASGSALNLTDATVKFVMRSLANAAATVNAAATIVNASTGQVSFTFTAADTAIAGLYMAQWIVTESGGGTYAFPNVGFRSIEVSPSLANAPQGIVSLPDAKDVLNFTADDDVHDTKILRWINACQVVIEQQVGPVVPKTIEEWHSGGHYQVVPRYTPNRAWGSDPLLIVNAISEYNGPIEWPLAMVSTPDEAILYSVIVDVATGTITRTTAGGGIQQFSSSAGPRSVHLWYTTGQNSVPANIYEAAIELLRQNYQKTAQSTNKGWGDAPEVPEAPKPGAWSTAGLNGLLGRSRKPPACA